jgi:hypothetical protein
MERIQMDLTRKGRSKVQGARKDKFKERGAGCEEQLMNKDAA